MYKEITARYFFENNQSHGARLDMIARAISVFIASGAENLRVSWQNDTYAFVLGSFKEDPARLHHTFESKIIRSFPIGCGAGELMDATKEELELFNS